MAEGPRQLLSVGINYPWKNYGWDFGLPPHGNDGIPWASRAAWRETLDEELRAFRQLGLFAVRWFILADGLTYGTGPLRPHIDAKHPEQWRFDAPPSLTPEFEEDFLLLLDRFAAAGLLLVPSLIDFLFCYPGMVLPGVTDFVKQGRCDVLIDPGKRRIFLDQVLLRLLEIAQPFRDTIYAWELINEPEWCTRDSGMGLEVLNPNKTVPAADMLAYLSEGAARINAAGFHSTVGLFHQTLSRWDPAALGVTRPQVHYYAQPPNLPDHDPDSPLFIGEFATASHEPWRDLSAGQQDVYHRLRLIESKGHPAAFLWSAELHPSATHPPVVDWSPATQALLRRYTSGE